MRTLDDVPKSERPSPMPLHETPWWLRALGCPRWRFRHEFLTPVTTNAMALDGVTWRQVVAVGVLEWVYVTRAQYRAMFGRVI